MRIIHSHACALALGVALQLQTSDGRMTLTANVDDAGWIAFGQCMAADQLVP